MVPSGVPQGSVIGPILFIVIISSRHPIHTNTIYIKYVDDLTCPCFGRNSKDDCLQAEFDHVCEWSAQHSMVVNSAKTKLLEMQSRRQAVVFPDLVESASGVVIPKVDSARLLGVILASNLKWNAHVNSVTVRANRSLYFLSLLRRSGCSQCVLERFYSANTRSIISYAYPAMCNMTVSLHNKLRRVERRASRIIGATVEPCLSEHFDAMCRRLAETVELHDSHPIRQLINKVPPSNHQLRNPKILRRPRSKTERLRTSFIKYF